MPKLAKGISLGVLMAAFSLTACNNKKKDDKPKEEPTIQMPDSITQKPTAPGDLNAPEQKMSGDTVVKKPTAPGD